MEPIERLAAEHCELTRRYFLGLGAAGALGVRLTAASAVPQQADELLKEAIARFEYLTKDENFRTFGRGNPPPHKLPVDKLRQVGLVRETWQMEVVADPDSNSVIERPLSKQDGTALDWQGLMRLARTKAVCFMSVVSCTNANAPLGMGLWEGVPLREVIWLTRPRRNIRRVFYYGYHNDDPAQRFQSSLPIGRVLEDPPGLHPVVLCYKLNQRWLTIGRGGPVRMLVPDQYGNKSVKWLQRVVLTNNPQSNDTYAKWNNDTVSYIKTCARFVHTSKKVNANEPAPITGVAQVGISGLSKVQYLLRPRGTIPAKDDPYFAKADWSDAEILPPPKNWGAGLEAAELPPIPGQLDPKTHKPLRWPMPFAIAHWAVLITIRRPGDYDLRCRTIDASGIAQPMPRPFLKSGKNDIQKVGIVAV